MKTPHDDITYSLTLLGLSSEVVDGCPLFRLNNREVINAST